MTLSGVQHYAFCPRQWALIFIEQQWADNERTVDGSVMHRRAHDETIVERRGDLLVMRGLRVQSHALQAVGVCDVVEFHSCEGGITLPGQEGTWQPYPVEYKRGAPKANDADALQLCGEAMCLEEMLCCDIPVGFLYYGETRHRTRVEITPELRKRVADTAEEMHQLCRKRHTPKGKRTKACNACSLKDICLPVLCGKKTAGGYLQKMLGTME